MMITIAPIKYDIYPGRLCISTQWLSLPVWAFLILCILFLGCKDEEPTSETKKGEIFIGSLQPGEEKTVEITFSIEAPDGYIFVPNELGGHYIKNIETGQVFNPDNGELITEDTEMNNVGMLIPTDIVEWPEVITNPDYEYTGENIKERAIADGLSAWGCCYLEKSPKNFGNGMLKIGKIIGCVATPEKLMELGNEITNPDNQ